MKKRGTTPVAALLLAFLVLVSIVTGCGSASDSPSSSATAGGPNSFPVTVATTYGSLTLKEEPKRIVVLGSNYLDMLNSIKVEPTAYYVYVEGTPATQLEQYPWLEGLKLGKYDAKLVDGGKPALEEIASYKPDLILGYDWMIDKAAYSSLSKIAPTFVGVSAGNNNWTDTMKALGKLTGKVDDADAAIADVDSKFSDVRSKLAGLQGKTYNYVAYDGTKFWYGNGSWLESFGLVPAGNQNNTQTGNNDISPENIDQLSADVLGIYDSANQREKLVADPLFERLPAATNGTAIFQDYTSGIASNGAGPRSLEWLIEKVLPQLEKSALNNSGS